jgi:adenine-specific DNA-methyltransferase
MERLDMHSPDGVEAKLSKLAELFPGVVSEVLDDNGELQRGIDLDALKQEFSSRITEGPKERYHLDWPGKKEATLLANAPVAKSLRPQIDESVDFENTKNVFIEGDNLDALKLLQETYLGKIKLIYIDPPYNTGNDFIYEDDYAENNEAYLLRSNQVDDSGNRLVSNPNSNGRFHSDWLSMMYSRLKLARNLLSEDGVIAISIDDNEQNRLVQLCDEVFGASNFVAQVVTQANKGGRDYLPLAQTHEYVIFYARDYAQAGFYELEKADDSLPLHDKNGAYEVRELRNRNPKFNRANRPNLFYPFYIDPENVDANGYASVSLTQDSRHKVEAFPRNSVGLDGCWRWGVPKSESAIVASDPVSSQLVAKETRNGNWNVYEKNRKSTSKAKTIWDETEMRTEAGTREVRRLMGAAMFDHPKSVELVKKILMVTTAPGGDDLVLDFFAGSGTTAQAVMVLNAEDGGNRRFILVQLAEACEDGSEAQKAGFKIISDVSRERIRLAGRDLGSFIPDPDWNGDVGFRSLKIDTSNVVDRFYAPSELTQESLALFSETVKSDRGPVDLLFQVISEVGLDLSTSFTSNFAKNDSTYNVNDGDLVACFASTVTEELIKAIAEVKPDRVVFLDSSFKTDAARINAEQVFKQLSPSTQIRVI